MHSCRSVPGGGRAPRLSETDSIADIMHSSDGSGGGSLAGVLAPRPQAAAPYVASVRSRTQPQMHTRAASQHEAEISQVCTGGPQLGVQGRAGWHLTRNSCSPLFLFQTSASDSWCSNAGCFLAHWG